MNHDHELRRRQITLELEAASADVRCSALIALHAQRVGFVASAMGLLTFLAGLSVWEQLNHRPPITAALCVLLGCGLAAFPIGLFSGWLAHRMFYGTRIPVPLMAVAFALLIDFTIFGWILVAL